LETTGYKTNSAGSIFPDMRRSIWMHLLKDNVVGAAFQHFPAVPISKGIGGVAMPLAHVD